MRTTGLALSTRHKPKPCPQNASHLHDHSHEGHSVAGSVAHAVVEGTDAFLHAAHLDHSMPHMNTGLRAGLGLFSAARGLKAVCTGKGAHSKLEGMASLGLSVACAGGLMHSTAGTVMSNVGQSVRGVAETALGAFQIWGKDHAGRHHEGREVIKGVLNCAKGLTTFLPMINHAASKAVGLFHLGVVGANLALEVTTPEPVH